MSYYKMNNMSGTNAPRQSTQAEEELKKEQQEQEIVDKELQRRADRREKIWKVLFHAFLVFVPVISITVGIYWKDIVDYLKYRPIFEDESEWYYKDEPESNEEEALVSVDSMSIDEQAEVESVTPATPTNSTTKSGSTSHWPNYSYSDLHRYDDDDDDDDDDDTWYRGDDDPDEYYEYDFHE